MRGFEGSTERAAGLLEAFVAGELDADPLVEDLVHQLRVRLERWRAGASGAMAAPGFDWVEALDELSRHDGTARKLIEEIAPAEPMPAAKDLHYLDFIIVFEAEEDPPRARLAATPSGQLGVVELDFGPWLEEGSWIERFSESLDLRNVGRRQAEGKEDSEWAELGRLLFRTLFAGRIRDAWIWCSGLLAGRSDLGVRVCLVFGEASERKRSFAKVPWELLRDPETNRPLCLDVRTPLVRSFERLGKGASRNRPVRRRRVLLVSANPRDLQSIEVRFERRQIEQALARFGSAHRADADLAALREKLASGGFAIFQFMGHGDFDEASGEGVLYFEDSAGNAVSVSGRMLSDQLSGLSLDLIVLSSCSGAALSRLSRSDSFAGVAAALVLDGVSSVLAMGIPVPDAAAVAFSQELYRRLAVGESLESALAEARLALQRIEPNSFLWAIPVLYRRDDDFRLA